MTGTMLEATGLSFGYTPDRGIIRDLSLAISAGTLTAVVGANGAGKTTLLRLLAGELTPNEGRIALEGTDLRLLSRRRIARSLAVVPQRELAEAPFTVRETVALGRYPWLSWLHRPGPADLALTWSLIERLDLRAMADRQLSGLSGGERRRVQLAMALAQQPSVLLMDEPTSYLDIRHQIDLLELVAEFCRSAGLAALAIFHDLNLAAAYADRILLLARGGVMAEGSPSSVLTPENIAAAFGIETAVTMAPNGRPQISLKKNNPAN